MDTWHDLTGLTLVVGLGVSGLSAVRALRALGAEVAVADSRPHPPGLDTLAREHPEVALHLGGFDAAVFARAARLLTSPGVALATPAVRAAAAAGIPVWGDIELLARLSTVPVAAITGSNGKSTVTTLLGGMAAAAGRTVAVGGNLGTAALDLWRTTEHAGQRPDLYVLELSSFQLETTASLNAAAATVLNLSPDHMDRYASVWDYAEAKRRVFRGGGVMVVNADDPLVEAMAASDRVVRRFRLGVPGQGEYGTVERDARVWLAHGDEPLLAADELRIGGRHNLANVLACFALGDALGLERAAMVQAARDFTGLAHRTQLVAEGAGVRWFDDSKGTNVGATVAAVAGLSGPLVVIAGGDGKGQDFAPLAAAFAGKVRAAVLIGRDAALLARALDGCVEVHRAGSMDAAVELAARLARPGDSVLLSPACASLDMFKDYAERGRVFAAAARRVVGC